MRDPPPREEVTDLAVDMEHTAKNDTIGSASEETPTPHKVRLLENGLLDLSETPAHLLKIAQHNATESPLLRLPGEIRNHIFGYAMGGYTIELQFSDCGACYYGFCHCKDDSPHHKHCCLTNPTIQVCEGHFWSTPKSPFALSRVCRQVYAETATLGYASCSFSFLDRTDFCLDVASDLVKWIKCLQPAHADAVTNISLPLDAFTAIFFPWGEEPSPWMDSEWPRTLEILPNLAHIILYSPATFDEEMSDIREWYTEDYPWEYKRYGISRISDGELLDTIQQSIINRMGNIHIEFEFEHGMYYCPSVYEFEGEESGGEEGD